MATHTCNQNCGCNNTYTVTAPCPPSCPEVFNAQCIVYTGTDILCGQDTVIKRYDYLDTVITKLVNYICNGLANIPVTVVQSDSEFLTVTPVVVGNTTTWVLDLVNLPGQQVYVVEAGGTNVTVGENTVGNTTTFTVTAQGTDVQSGDDYIDVSVTQVGDDDIVTLTLDINEVAQAIGEVSVAQGTSDNVIVTTVNNFPTPGDTQYRLDVVATDVQSTDSLITVTQSGGTAPAYDQLFELAMNSNLLREFIMDTTSGTAPVGGIVGDTLSGIDVQYDPVTHTLTIINTAGLPKRWLTLGNGGVDADIPAGSPNDKFNIVGDAVINGISVQLASGPGANEASFTIVNEDRGSAQLTFLNVDCLNVSGNPGGTATATINEDTLTLVGGTDIDLTVVGNQITIDNLIDRVYSEIQSDAGDTLQAPNTTSTFTIAGGTGIGTIGNLGTQTITINNEGVTSLTSADANLSVDVTTGNITITNTAPNVDQFLWLTFEGDTGIAINATTTTDALTVAGGDGITTNTTGTTLTITADVQREVLDSTSNPTQLPYTGGAGAQAITHTLGEIYVNVRCFNGLVDVTDTTIITMVNSTTFTIDSAGNITNVLVLG